MTHLCDQNRVYFGTQSVLITDLCTEVEIRLDARDLSDHRVAFVVDTMREALGCVAYGIAKNLDFGVIERSRLTDPIEDRFAENAVQLRNASDGSRLGRPPVKATVQPGRITVLTSGTTGLLKLIPHSADTLNTFDRVDSLPENTWFLPYQIGSYAWYQMVSLGLFKQAQHLVPGDMDDLSASFESALKTGVVTAVSSTPTFWRYMLMSIDEPLLAAAPLQSISMGGEIVDQAILDRLKSLYPQARIRHIYASSETGAAIVVSDGQAGFSADLLDRKDAAICVKVEDDHLFIRSPYANKDDGDGWVDTGDLVEQRDGRVYFLGRAGNTMINVGGQKAFPPDIEAHLIKHPNVIWARVTARRAPLMGTLPVATVVLNTDMNFDDAEHMLITHCEAELAEYAVPRMWDFLAEIPMQASLKS